MILNAKNTLMLYRGKTLEFILSKECKVFRERNLLSSIFGLNPNKIPNLYPSIKNDILAYRNECIKLETYEAAEEQFIALLANSRKVIHIVTRYDSKKTIKEVRKSLDNISKFFGNDHPDVKILLTYVDS